MLLKRYILLVLVGLAPSLLLGQTLKEALEKKDTVVAISLINKGADINEVDVNGTSALMTACRWADADMVRFLLWHGAAPDKPRSPKGRTPLMIACAYYGGQSICEMLLQKGADVNAAATDGTTALMLAAQNAKLDVVALLLKKGSYPGAKDAAGKTALDYANKADVSDYLIKSVKDTQLDKQAVINLLEKAK